jgi:hypothetical protein
MRPRHLITLAACGVALACGENSKAPFDVLNGHNVFNADSGSGSTVQVTVVGLTRDSTFRPIENAQVIFMRVGDVPPDSVPDSLPPPPPPPDSMPPTDSLTVGMGSSPTYPFQLDSIPGDSTPPPPPPPFSCGREGRILARGRTNQFGIITVNGLRSGKYDIVVEPPLGSQFKTGGFCGLHLLPEQSAQIGITLIR